MTSTISDFMPQLLTHPEIQELVQTHFGEQAAHILQGMRDGSLGRDEADELEELLTGFIIDHGEEVASFEGLGGPQDSLQATIAYFQEHHPEAKALIDKMGGAPGFESSVFNISVLRYKTLYVVTAQDFEDTWFASEHLALNFARENYEPWIKNYKIVQSMK